MTNGDTTQLAILSIRLDLLSAHVLASVARAGRTADLTDAAHAFFVDRYRRLADHHRRHGREASAQRLEAKAAEHGYVPDDEPPFAAAMAMPRPRAWVKTLAVGQRLPRRPDDAA